MSLNIYVCSKGRPEGKTLKMLEASEAVPHYYLIVEPQDEELYKNQGFKKSITIVLPQNDQGVAYARRFVVLRAREAQQEQIWMLDDDISSFTERRSAKLHPIDIGQALTMAQDHLMKVPNLAVGALEYGQYAWAAKKPYALNSYCEVATLLNLNNLKLCKYRDDVKEDRDLVLQALSLGYMTARTTLFAFNAPKNGSNKGGLHEAYKAGLERHWSANMVKLWPGVCSLHTKADGRPDVKINWAAFKKS